MDISSQNHDSFFRLHYLEKKYHLIAFIESKEFKGYNISDNKLSWELDEIINQNFEILIIGNYIDRSINQKVHHKIHWIGKIDNDLMLSELINCADLLVLPSRIDNLPQTGLEAQACGLPIVAFDTNGIKDLVEHKVDGYLAKPYDTKSIKDGIEWILNELDVSNDLFKSTSLLSIHV